MFIFITTLGETLYPKSSWENGMKIKILEVHRAIGKMYPFVIFIKKENSKSKFKPTIPQERNSSLMQQQKWRTRYE